MAVEQDFISFCMASFLFIRGRVQSMKRYIAFILIAMIFFLKAFL